MMPAAPLRFLLVLIAAATPLPAHAEAYAAGVVPSLTELQDEIDWAALNESGTWMFSPAQRRRGYEDRSNGAGEFWKRGDNRDGSAAVTYGRSLYPDYDAKVGVDLGLAAPPSAVLTPEQHLAPLRDNSAGAGWASFGLPGAKMEARVDPAQETRKIGTSLSRSVPLTRDLSVTVNNDYSMTQSLHHGTIAGAAPDIAAAPGQVFSTERRAKINVLPSGTSLSAGTSTNTLDEKWLRSLGAEQRLFGGVSISGTVSELPAGDYNRSLSAGFKKNW